MMKFKTEDGRFTKTVKIISTVATVIGVLVSLGTAGVKVSKMNTWDTELTNTEEKLNTRIDTFLDKQKQLQCEYINKELNLIKAKERSEELKAYDLYWRDELQSRKEQVCQ